MAWSRPVWKVGLLLLAVVVLVPLLGAWRWQGTTAELIARLDSAAADPPARAMPDLSGVPAPVSRYFARALPPDAGLIRHVVATQAGEFRTGEGDDSWRPFGATEYFSSMRPGFVWDARIRMVPLVSVHVRDAYVGGAGSMRASIAGVFDVVNDHARRELDIGALQRYLAETVWFPTALLPGPMVTWEAVDEGRARATMSDGSLSASAEFRFNESGDVIEVRIPDRFREVRGRYEPTPWLVSCSEHEVRGGFRIPGACVVEWQLPAGPMPYWRGRVVEIEYGF